MLAILCPASQKVKSQRNGFRNLPLVRGKERFDDLRFLAWTQQTGPVVMGESMDIPQGKLLSSDQLQDPLIAREAPVRGQGHFSGVNGKGSPVLIESLLPFLRQRAETLGYSAQVAGDNPRTSSCFQPGTDRRGKRVFRIGFPESLAERISGARLLRVEPIRETVHDLRMVLYLVRECDIRVTHG